jgi:hypothetical protein
MLVKTANPQNDGKVDDGANPKIWELKLTRNFPKNTMLVKASKNTELTQLKRPAMPRLHKKLDNALLTQIRNAVYYGT